MSRPLLIGLTGGIASGKSTVARLLGEHGFLVVDADRLVAELYGPGAAGTAAVRELFGDGVLNAEGGVDHPALAAKVFTDPAARGRLEAAIHPLVGQRFLEIAAASEAPVVLEATLLVESGQGEAMDVVITVEADAELRLERAVARGMERADAAARLAAQGDGAERRGRADIEIRNDGTLAELQRQVADLAAQLLRPPTE